VQPGKALPPESPVVLSRKAARPVVVAWCGGAGGCGFLRAVGDAG
jgi:hypothetical protein